MICASVGSVLLGILKVLGILLLSVLGLILLILLIVLLVPFRYETEARFRDNKVRAKARFSWLLRLLNVLFHWKEDKGLLRIKVGPKTVKAKKLGKWPGKEKKKKKKEQKQEAEETSPEAADIWAAGEEIPEETVVSAETVPCDGTASAEPPAGTPEPGPSPEGSGEEETEPLKDKLRRWYDLAKDFLEDEQSTEAVALIGRQLRRIGRHFLPTLFRIEGRLGLGDPARTGRLIGKIYAFYPVYGDAIRLDGVYDRKEIDLYLHMKGRLRLGIFVGAALRLLMNRRIRQWIRQLIRKKKEDAKDGEPAPEKSEEKAA